MRLCYADAHDLQERWVRFGPAVCRGTVTPRRVVTFKCYIYDGPSRDNSRVTKSDLVWSSRVSELDATKYGAKNDIPTEVYDLWASHFGLVGSDPSTTHGDNFQATDGLDDTELLEVFLDHMDDCAFSTVSLRRIAAMIQRDQELDEAPPTELLAEIRSNAMKYGGTWEPPLMWSDKAWLQWKTEIGECNRDGSASPVASAEIQDTSDGMSDEDLMTFSRDFTKPFPDEGLGRVASMLRLPIGSN
jgi:hypothetical protein